MKIVIRNRIFAPPYIRQCFYDDYGGLDYRNKTVLDVGADWGCTAKFFLSEGARSVIAVEKNKRFAIQLFLYSLYERRVKAIRMNVSRKENFISLFRRYRPDIVKLDCEGGERYLLDADDATFNCIPEYVMEVHGKNLRNRFIRRFRHNGYSIIKDYWLRENLWIIQAERKRRRAK